jgi:hypothetical protein
MTQSNQITPARPLQAHKRSGTYLALVHDSGAEAVSPAPVYGRVGPAPCRGGRHAVG